MIKDNQRYFNRMHVVIDAVVIIVSYFLAWAFRYAIFSAGAVQSVTFYWYMRLLIGIVPVYLILYYAFNLYTPKRVQGRRLELSNIVKANTVGMLLLICYIVVILREVNFARLMFLYFYLLNIILEELVRISIRRILRKLRKSGFNLKHILLVGYSRSAEEYIKRIIQNPQWGYHITGILDDNVEIGKEYKGIKVIGRVAELMTILPQNGLDEIAITLGLSEYDQLEEIVALCEKSGVHTKFIPDYQNIIPTKPYTEDLLGLPVVNIRYVPLTNTFNAVVKRLMDIGGSLFAIVLFSPVMLFACAMIKLTSPGPLIYKQERVGLHNRTFMMYKFRSMEVQSKEAEKKAWTVKDDPRVTSFGKLMRKTSIDELPQLFNILKGDMSLIGPRPERPFFVEKFREEIPRYMVKHQVRP
ncbi:MAG: exopolysaccharide biosynthesis polyprenyl glycosylphosphotransferase, partial [Ruminococcus sp.]|nr:exopolysaccharide biosynthesis polyprenyl glycosylphosphotransferase [Ruminococcus sp.]